MGKIAPVVLALFGAIATPAAWARVDWHINLNMLFAPAPRGMPYYHGQFVDGVINCPYGTVAYDYATNECLVRRTRRVHTEVIPGKTEVKKIIIPAVPVASFTTPDGRVCREDVSRRTTRPDGKLDQFWVDCK